MNLAAELHRTEQRLMVWPRSPRLIRKVQALRQVLAHQQEAQARALRGKIRQNLMSLDLNTLARLAREMESAS